MKPESGSPRNNCRLDNATDPEIHIGLTRINTHRCYSTTFRPSKIPKHLICYTFGPAGQILYHLIMKEHRHSALIFVLKGLMPYSRESMLLAFKPNRFFNELEQLSGYSQKTLRTSYYRARRSGMLTIQHDTPRLTTRGKQQLQPFIATRLSGNAQLMVIFDVPETASPVRRQFRLALRKLDFTQVQQSVWMTAYDHRKLIEEIVNELNLENCVQIYEAARLFPK